MSGIVELFPKQDKMAKPHADVKPSVGQSIITTPSDTASLSSQGRPDDKPSKDAPPLAQPLATQENQRMEAALGDAVLRFLRIRKGPKGEKYDLDAVWAKSCLFFF